ncbi:MAG: endonuclease/exonuclease/phosphatase family protein [Akkermansiaceae bacterium]
MKILSTVLPLMVIMTCASPAQDAEQALVHQGGLELKLMSFNIRNGTANDEDNHWNLRKDLVYQVIRDDAPDILGLQEAVYAQQEELLKELPQYAYVGTGSGGGTKGQYSSILYLRQQFKLAASGTFWLSETPFIPSRHWGSAHLRICTWARLLHRDTGHTILVYNTHLDDGSKKAREKGAAMIMKHARDHAHDHGMGRPFIVMGDFNAREDSETVALVRGEGDLAGQASIEMVDSFRALHPEQNNVGTYNGFKGDASGAKIDYIFVPASARVAEAAIVKTHQNGRYPSDHFPVTARVRFEQPASSKKGQDQDAKSSHRPDLTVPPYRSAEKSD